MQHVTTYTATHAAAQTATHTHTHTHTHCNAPSLQNQRASGYTNGRRQQALQHALQQIPKHTATHAATHRHFGISERWVTQIADEKQHCKIRCYKCQNILQHTLQRTVTFESESVGLHTY